MATKKDDLQDSVPMQQFDEMKAKHPDAILLFRRNDSYETYRQDAVKAKQILGLDIESREIGGKKIYVVGFKHHSLDMYLPKLVRAGMRVAIFEQLEAPRQKKAEKESKETLSKSTDMSKKKKEESPAQEQPKAKADAKTEAKVDAKSEQKQEAQQERKPREPQMVTVNGDKVTHGHAFQSKENPENWYFTAKINGEQLKPQKMTAGDLAAFRNKDVTVPQLMERYYPTKLLPKVPEVAYQVPNVVAGPNGNMTVDKFNVYKEKDEQRADFGRYKFYAQVGDQKMSAVPSRQDLNSYFDRVMTPGQLVEKNFGERLHLSSHYEQFKLPESVQSNQIRIAKDRSDGKWKVSVDLGEAGRTSKKEMSFDDGFSLYKTKTATREQIAAKYVGDEVKSILANPVKMEKSASMKM